MLLLLSFIGLKVADAKGSFFDRKPVKTAADRATRRVLSKFGAFVRRTARGLLRKRKKSSEPGKPPSSHAGFLKKLIFFIFEPRRQSVLIGPALLNEKRTMGPPVPELLEEGGTATRQFLVITEDRTASGRKRPGPPARGQSAKVKYRFSRKAPRRRVRYEPRPFMGPAFEKELPQVPQMWRDAVKP